MQRSKAFAGLREVVAKFARHLRGCKVYFFFKKRIAKQVNLEGGIIISNSKLLN